MKLEPGALVGKYRLERALAEGGMGAIWTARHVDLDVGVAIKFIQGSTRATPGAEARFKREAKAAAHLKSPHVVGVHDYGVEGDTSYIAMELLLGEDLGERLAREGRIPLSELAPILTQAAKGLRAAHDAGIIHRDIKPSNIYLARAGGEVIVKILDFGIAKETATPAVNERTATGTVIGSPYYMSPEHARGEPIDHRTDLWSLGVVAFEALTGRRPFESSHLGGLVALLCTAAAPPPSSVLPSLSPEIDAFFARALARDASERFPSATEMAAAFAALGGPDAAPAPPPRRAGGRGETRTLPAPGSDALTAPPSTRSTPPAGAATARVPRVVWAGLVLFAAAASVTVLLARSGERTAAETPTAPEPARSAPASVSAAEPVVEAVPASRPPDAPPAPEASAAAARAPSAAGSAPRVASPGRPIAAKPREPTAPPATAVAAPPPAPAKSAPPPAAGVDATFGLPTKR